MLTDRNDLDDQLFGQFQRCADILGQMPVQASGREHLRELLNRASGGVVFTTIHKFMPEKGEAMPELSARQNIVVIADEAHRSQYGFSGKVNEKTGEMSYGFASNLRDALPNASFIGFTGTPIEKTDANTRAVFGDYISIYDIQRAVADKATVPIYYESRISKLALNAAEVPKLDAEFEKCHNISLGQHRCEVQHLASKPQNLMAKNQLFAGYPSAIVYELGADGGTAPPKKLKALKHLLWGDYMTLVSESDDGDFYRVKVRGVEGWIKAEETQAERILEIVFVDIGQGDGALVVTPEDKKYVIDAGQGDNMFRFLRWRFGFKRKVTFDAAIMSHSDADHYGGFDYLFDEPNVSFKTVYTNGIMERVAASKTESLGKPTSAGGKKYITDLVPDLAALKVFLAKPGNWKGKKYPAMLEKALANRQFADFRMLDVRNKHLPGHEADADLEIQVLGPYPETAGGKLGLRWFGDVGKTKNGHSVVLRFVMNGLKIFMGGDLNIESSRLLLEMHTGLSAKPKNAEEEFTLVTAARKVFGCDVAKACHHGSADTLLPFMKSINPLATVISSGDDEPHAHPRADALGAIAKCSRGERPLLLSTELARSAKESIKQPNALRRQLTELAKKVDEEDDPKKKAAAQKKFDAIVAKLDRSIAVYGAINLRTDGTRVVMAYKLERSKPAKGWDIYLLEPAGENGPLIYKSKYD